MNPYEVLGVPHTASADDIKQARRRLASMYHPDREQSPEDALKMRDVNAAYDILSDPERRAGFDKYGIDPKVLEIDKQCEQLVTDLLQQYFFSAAEDHNVLGLARESVRQGRQDNQQKLALLRQRHATLTKKRNLLRVKKGNAARNLWAEAVDRQLARMSDEFKSFDTAIALSTRMLEMLDAYETDAPPPPGSRRIYGIDGLDLDLDMDAFRYLLRGSRG